MPPAVLALSLGASLARQGPLSILKGGYGESLSILMLTKQNTQSRRAMRSHLYLNPVSLTVPD